MQKIISFLKKQKLFIFLILILLILMILRFFFKTTKEAEKLEQPLPSERKKEFIIPKKEPLRPSSSPKTLSESELGEEEVKETLELYPLIEYLPINNERYHLTYTDPFGLTATIKQGDQEEIKKEIISWIVSKNIDPSTHKIIFQ